ncbi:uncharacterized protein LOC100371400 [Saccoglossus kowalevskii]|uniref:Uncharacterized protein LOC100371400 n=1 Tax=Saccoglossus kowalevskii TaxID=10224 RepID=A0ABM0GM55_SACKO|nr:PREDICTED: uncharacterized protein LOC100371400 [Saccoglossus kowalevskii]
MEEEMEIETTTCADNETISTRRRNPFGTATLRSQEASHNHQMNIKRSALEILMHSGSQQNSLPSLGSFESMNDEDLIIPRSRHDCWICHQPSDTIPCSFCEHQSCELCVRQCERCCGVFCSFCSTVNYTGKHDKPFCLGCNTEVNKTKHLH